MPTPRVPSSFRPAAQAYSIGAPDGVRMNEVAGGMPRVGLQWNRGWQEVPIYRAMKPDEFAAWTVFFHRRINSGSLQFLMPMNLGMGMADHLCVMVPGSYSANPLSGNRVWAVTFRVKAQNPIYDMSEADVDGFLALWEEVGEDLGPLLARLAKLVTVDSLVLQP